MNLVHLKYADLLGKPLTKSLYKQLPAYFDSLITLNEGTQIMWDATVHGKINWCPPGCKVDTNCDCEDKCLKLTSCKTKRAHQHLLIGAKESLYQGYVYLYLKEYDEYPVIDEAWEKIDLLQKTRNVLTKTIAEYNQRTYVALAQLPTGSQQALREKYTHERQQLEVATKELMSIEHQCRVQCNHWIDKALDALPVILLRG